MALYVGASARTRRWPAARFAAVAAHAARAWDAEVWVLAGASEEEATIARRVLDAVEKDERRVRVLSGLPLADLVGAIGAADLLVSNDTGPMHLGSALGVPTLGIFSESLPLHYQPVGANDRYVRKESVEAVEVSEVVGLMAEMWLTASRGRRP